MSAEESVIPQPLAVAATPELDWRRRGSRPATVRLAAGLLAILTIAVLGNVRVWLRNSPSATLPEMAIKAPKATLQFDPAKLTSSDPASLKILTSDQALAANTARAISALPNPASRPMTVLRESAPDYQRSLDCLTLAIYYESAFEPADGQRAVAQVVLNRVRHPLFSHTVCGVVFQGSERTTGCQFSFTCDGSLARIPNASVWRRIREIAAAALGGYVYRPAGLATHYHADYVIPYWADSLVKSAVIGHHIFYRIPGGYGGPAAFSASYAGNEPVVAAGAAAGLLLQADDQTAIAPAFVSTERSVLDAFGRNMDPSNSSAAAALTNARKATMLSSLQPPGSVANRRGSESASSRRWVLPIDGGKSIGEPAKQKNLPVD